MVGFESDTCRIPGPQLGTKAMHAQIASKTSERLVHGFADATEMLGEQFSNRSQIWTLLRQGWVRAISAYWMD
ncbi:hypothetical protein EDM68_00865 [Candidatus Uhrbacteria bacterium]|nr:MAG: hypothetical protein EDM68_00865 [Candidatus Uhrbacteria bacterium]